MGIKKDRNHMDLTEAEGIKKRWQEYTEELYKKDLYDPDNHDGMITHLEPDILECDVKWAFGSITTNKASGGYGIPAELFQILKDDGVKVLHSICQQIWGNQQWPQDWKRSIFIPIPKKSNAKECSNDHTIALISVRFSCSVMSDSLRPHELQHARPPCLSPTPGVHSDSRPSSQWCHPATSSSVVPFSSCPQSFPASESFPMSQLFARGGQSTGVLAFSIIPSKEVPGLISFRMDWLDLLAVQGTLKSLLQHHSSKASILQHSAFFTVQLSHLYMTTGKTIALTRHTFAGKVMSLLLNMLSKLVITFLPRSKRLLISWHLSPPLAK